MTHHSASGAADRWGDRLPRRLGLWSAVAVLVGSTIGGGIFRTPAIIAERVPAPLAMFGVWTLGGVLALCGALTYAELAALFPRSGGVYVYLREGFGRLPAFLFGWARSEEHTSELSHLVISYAVFCLKKKKKLQIALNTSDAKKQMTTMPTRCH